MIRASITYKWMNVIWFSGKFTGNKYTSGTTPVSAGSKMTVKRSVLCLMQDFFQFSKVVQSFPPFLSDGVPFPLFFLFVK